MWAGAQSVLLWCWAMASMAGVALSQVNSGGGAGTEHLGTISGSISNAITGAPVPAATLLLDSEGHTKSFAVSSDAFGRFSFRLIEPGRYYLRADCDGFVARFFGGRGSAETRRPLLVEAGRELLQIDIPLMPTGTISGRVEDEFGRPIVRAEVQPLRAVIRRGKVEWAGSGWSAVTDDRGQYRCFHLEPGRYLVQVTYPEQRNSQLALPQSSAPPGRPLRRLAYTPAFYPGTITAKDGVVVEVAPGQERAGIDIHLSRVPVASVRGHVVDESSGGFPKGFASVFLRRLDEPGTRFLSPRYDYSTKGFEFALLPPGQYQISCSVGNKRAKLVVELAGVDIEGVSLVLRSGAPVRGRVAKRANIGCDHFGELASSEIEVGLSALTDEPDSYSAPVRADGTFEFQEMPAGEYRLTFIDPQSHCFVQSFSLPGMRTTGKAIVVPENGLSELEVVPGAAGSVAGVVRDQEGKAVPGVHVICIGPDDSSGEVVPTCGPAVTDQQGMFELKYLLPGEIHLVALTEFDPESADLRSLREVLSHSQVVRVEENKKQVVDLELSSKSN